ncbi:MAG: glutamate racemase [Chloroflexaceae bacterium]|jgi:glutamate racemase|nr:glutamate racemase [Chloroflexaceae bacterium]
MTIGLYDSGLGGLSVLQAVRALLPDHDLLYLADTAYCPYGPRPIEQVRERARACAGWLVNQGASLVVVACNTATSAAIETLRAELPLPVVGMEPGLKPAITATRTRRIAVLATGGTLTGNRFHHLVERFADGVEVQTVACPALVEQVEAGDLDSPRTRAILADYLAPLPAAQVDVVVLGCTHFPFLTPLIAEMLGPGVTIVDTGPAVARQVARLAATHCVQPGVGGLRLATTGDPNHMARIVPQLVGVKAGVEQAVC